MKIKISLKEELRCGLTNNRGCFSLLFKEWVNSYGYDHPGNWFFEIKYGAYYNIPDELVILFLIQFPVIYEKVM